MVLINQYFLRKKYMCKFSFFFLRMPNEQLIFFGGNFFSSLLFRSRNLIWCWSAEKIDTWSWRWIFRFRARAFRF